VIDALIKPIEIMIKDPAVFFMDVYTALSYGIFLIFFEAFEVSVIEKEVEDSILDSNSRREDCPGRRHVTSSFYQRMASTSAR
jgi:hypothetical protein